MSLPSGIDTAAKITADIAKKTKAIGQQFVGRYLVPYTKSFPSKNLTADEAKIIHEAGLGILLCYETTASRPKQGASAGTEDGKVARELATMMHVPHDVCIYFAVDYNAPEKDYDVIEAYMRAASAAVSPYQMGVYGSYTVVEQMYLRGVTVNLWQCCAWSGKLISPHAFLYQRQGSGGSESKIVAAKIGVAVDMNTCGSLEKAHLWMPGSYSHWYDECMAWAKDNGLMDGTRPDDTATRAEIAQMFYNLMHREKK